MTTMCESSVTQTKLGAMGMGKDSADGWQGARDTGRGNQEVGAESREVGRAAVLGERSAERMDRGAAQEDAERTPGIPAPWEIRPVAGAEASRERRERAAGTAGLRKMAWACGRRAERLGAP